MRELHSAVIGHLKTKRESERAIELWEKLWAAFEKRGADGVAELVEKLAKLPESDDEDES